MKRSQQWIVAAIMKEMRIPSFAIFLGILSASQVLGQSIFTDDFNRPDSSSVGNGWQNTMGNQGGNLAIVNDQLSAIAPNGGEAGIYRPFDLAGSGGVSATIYQQSGYYSNLFGRYDATFAFDSNGQLQGGYGLEFSRGDTNYNDSTVTLFDGSAGGAGVASVASSFQFGSSINVQFSVNKTGAVSGQVSEGANTFKFNFGPRPIQSTGSNFSVTTGLSSTGTQPRIDDLAINSLGTISTTAPPPQGLTSHYSPTPNNLELYNPATKTFGSGQIDTSLPTVVLTHGFASDPSMWGGAGGFASALHATEPKVNILAWNWSTDASGSLPYSTSRTDNEGSSLADALLQALGGTYSLPLHFYGHSLGTLVNSEAVDKFHIFDPAVKMQDTLFDEASVAGQFVSSSNSASYINPIPQTGAAVRIDNYISSFGQLHPDAANIILQTDPGISVSNTDPNYWVQFHHYPIDWYQGTIVSPSLSSAGFAGAIEKGGTNLGDAAFQAGTYALQSASASNYWALSSISVETAVETLNQRNSELLTSYSDHPYKVSAFALFKGLTLDQIGGAIAVENGAMANLIPKQNGSQTTWVPEIILTKQLMETGTQSAANPSANLKLAGSAVPSDSYSSYASVPLSIPANVQFITFDFTFHGLSQDDFLSVGIGSTPLFQLETQFTPEDVTQNSGPIDITTWSGQDVDLFLGLEAVDGSNAGGTITIDNIAFGSVPEPSGIVWLVGAAAGLVRVRRESRWAITDPPSGHDNAGRQEAAIVCNHLDR